MKEYPKKKGGGGGGEENPQDELVEILEDNITEEDLPEVTLVDGNVTEGDLPEVTLVDGNVTEGDLPEVTLVGEEVTLLDDELVKAIDELEFVDFDFGSLRQPEHFEDNLGEYEAIDVVIPSSFFPESTSKKFKKLDWMVTILTIIVIVAIIIGFGFTVFMFLDFFLMDRK